MCVVQAALTTVKNESCYSALQLVALSQKNFETRRMDRDASSSDPSDEELVSRHVFALEQRVSHLENIIHRLSERLGQLEEQVRVAESHFTSAAQAAQEARYQASWGRLRSNSWPVACGRVSRAWTLQHWIKNVG